MIRFLTSLYVLPYLFYRKWDAITARLMAQAVCSMMIVLLWANCVIIAKYAFDIKLIQKHSRIEIIEIGVPTAIVLMLIFGALAKANPNTRDESAIQRFYISLSPAEKHVALAFMAVNVSLVITILFVGTISN